MSVARPRILTLDIETMPAVVETWSLFRPMIGIEQVREPTRVACFAAKWHGDSRVSAFSELDGHDIMVTAAAHLLDEADLVVTYNGVSFDLPHLRREILRLDIAPPSPWKNIDLFRVVKRHFRFQSHKLAFVARELGLEDKADTGGYELWKRCMAGDERAWRTMIAYCRQDVRVTEALYDRLLPWISTHPNVNLWRDSETPACPRCGSGNLERRGYHHAVAQSYQQYRCRDCGAWSRGTGLIRKAAGETRPV